MTQDYLIVVDMQNDFVSGSLGSADAQKIVDRVVKKVQTFDGIVLFTQDTHHEDYLTTQEGRLLPVPHCIEGTDGCKLIPPLEQFQKEHHCMIYQKNQFGSIELARYLAKQNVSSIQLIGLCTDICVVSNALLLKASLPEVPIKVDAACCAGV